MKRDNSKIMMGDKVYAKVWIAGNTLVELVMDGISCMSELLTELRHQARRYKGLVQIYIRNMSRGWSMQRPLMLYGSQNAECRQMAIPAAPQRTMAFPWETH